MIVIFVTAQKQPKEGKRKKIMGEEGFEPPSIHRVVQALKKHTCQNLNGLSSLAARGPSESLTLPLMPQGQRPEPWDGTDDA